MAEVVLVLLSAERSSGGGSGVGSVGILEVVLLLGDREDCGEVGMAASGDEVSGGGVTGRGIDGIKVVEGGVEDLLDLWSSRRPNCTASVVLVIPESSVSKDFIRSSTGCKAHSSWTG